jgi:glutamyl-tRNA reductase
MKPDRKMKLLVLGLNHLTTPVEVREKVAISSGQLKEALSYLLDHVEQGIILSTCNRTEVYTLSDGHRPQGQRATDFLSHHSGISTSQLAPHLYTHSQETAVRHLFRVASGLDSMIVGEYEILGQVRYALEEAETTGVVHLPLLNLFRQAVRVGRRARDETAIGRNAVSVSSAGVQLAARLFKDIAGCKVLVISAGEAGKLVAKALVKNGVAQLTVASRTYERASALASQLGGEAVPFHRMEEAMMASDIVVSSSGAPHFILEPSVVAEAMRIRPQWPLLLIDIAVPRDVDPRVKDIDNVFLYDIDDLNEFSEMNRRQRQREVEKVMAIIKAEVAEFMAWWNCLEVRPIIAALVDKAEDIRSAQLSKALGRMEGLSAEELARIEAMTRAIVKGILHHPISCLKGDEQAHLHAQAIQKLFDLKPKR